MNIAHEYNASPEYLPYDLVRIIIIDANRRIYTAVLVLIASVVGSFNYFIMCVLLIFDIIARFTIPTMTIIWVNLGVLGFVAVNMGIVGLICMSLYFYNVALRRVKSIPTFDPNMPTNVLALYTIFGQFTVDPLTFDYMKDKEHYDYVLHRGVWYRARMRGLFMLDAEPVPLHGA